MDIYHVNAFTSEACQGNPATVCVPTLGRPCVLSDNALQIFASEICKVEVVYLLPPERGSTAEHRLRFFTQKREMNFCGHATLAAAHVIFLLHPEKLCIEFQTKDNPSLVCSRKSPSDKKILMTLHPKRPLVDNTLMPSLRTLLESGLDVPRNAVCDIIPHKKTGNLIFVLKSAKDVVHAKPNLDALRQLAPKGYHKVTITAPARDDTTLHNRGVDFVTRLFAPWIGIGEDAVSAASNAILALYWCDEMRKYDLTAVQASHRPGTMVMAVSKERECVDVSGEAVVVTKGSLMASLSHL